MLEKLLTVDELREWLQVERSWIYRRVKAGDLPAIKFGRQLRFRPAEIEAWLAKGSVNAEEVTV